MNADARMSSFSASTATTRIFQTAAGNPISVQSSGLDAITFASLFDENGVQFKCPGKCLNPVTGTTHHCMVCGGSIHCAILCGADYSIWYEDNVKIGLKIYMLPPHGQSKLEQYGGVPPPHSAICNYCINSLDAKMAMKQPDNSSSTLQNRVSPSFSLSTFDNDDGAEDDDEDKEVVYHTTRPSFLPDRDAYFYDSKQTICAAAGGHCKKVGVDLPSSTDYPDYVCIVCDLAMHVACAVNYRQWIANISRQANLPYEDIFEMLPTNAQEKIRRAFPNSSHLNFCLRCKENVESTNNLVGLGSTTASSSGRGRGCGGSGSGSGESTKRKSTKKSKPPKAPPRVNTFKELDWDAHIKSSATWKDMVVTATECNLMMRQHPDLFTALKGFMVGDTLVEIQDITVIPLRDAAKKIGIVGYGSLTKPALVKVMLALHNKNELEEARGITVPTNVVYDNVNVIWNVPRIINIIFSDEFKGRFAERGQHLTKEQLDAGIKVDQELYTDFGIAYNDESIESYGILAEPEQACDIEANPARFQLIDSSNWVKTKTFVNDLFKEYESSLLRWRVSGTHGQYAEKLCDIKPHDNATSLMVYMHHFMCLNNTLLEQCAGMLDADTAFETVPGGGLNSSSGRRRCSDMVGLQSGNGQGDANGGKRRRTRKPAPTSHMSQKANTGHDFIGALTYSADVWRQRSVNWKLQN